MTGLTFWALKNEQKALANEQEANKQKLIAEQKRVEADQQRKLAETKTVEAEENAKEVSRRLASHYMYQADELLNIKYDSTPDIDEELNSVSLICEAMQLNPEIQKSVTEQIKLNNLINKKLIPNHIFHHESEQKFILFKDSYAISVGKDSTLQIYNLATAQKCGQSIKFQEPLTGAIFNKDASLVAVWDAKFTWIFDCKTGKKLNDGFEANSKYKYSDKHLLYVNRPVIKNVQFMDDNRVVINCLSNIKIFKIGSASPEQTLTPPEGYHIHSFSLFKRNALYVDFFPESNSNKETYSEIIFPENEKLNKKIVNKPYIAVLSSRGQLLQQSDESTYLEDPLTNTVYAELKTKRRYLVYKDYTNDLSHILYYYEENDLCDYRIIGPQNETYTIPGMKRADIARLKLINNNLLFVYYTVKRKMQVWNFKTGKQILETSVKGYPEQVRCSPDQKKFLYTYNNKVYFFDVASGLHESTGSHLSKILDARFISNTEAVSSDGKSLRKWKFPNASTEPHKIKIDKGVISSIVNTIINHPPYLYIPSSENYKNYYFSIYNFETKEMLVNSQALDGSPHFEKVRFIGEYLAIPFWNKSRIKKYIIWDLKKGKKINDKFIKEVFCLISLDDKKAVYLTHENSLCFQNFETGQSSFIKMKDLYDAIPPTTPDGKYLIVYGKDKNYGIDLENKKIVYESKSFGLADESWIPGEQAFWALANDDSFYKVKWTTGEVLLKTKHMDKVRNLFYYPKEDLLISSGTVMDGEVFANSSLKFWDGNGKSKGLEYPGSAWAFKFTPDRKKIYFDHEGFNIVDLATMTWSKFEDAFSKKTPQVRINHGKKYFVVQAGNELRTYDINTLKPLNKPFNPKGDVFAPSFKSFLADDEILVFGSNEKIYLYQTKTGHKLKSFDVKDYLTISDRGYDKKYTLMNIDGIDKIIISNKIGELVFINYRPGHFDFQKTLLKAKILSEQRIDKTGSLVGLPKIEIIDTLRAYRKGSD